ncbi:MAG: hypothetical protein QOH06_6319 [Acidobacteriota bacterium]|nr:hypothetical protein [Acidobacteriota bacterium]
MDSLGNGQGQHWSKSVGASLEFAASYASHGQVATRPRFGGECPVSRRGRPVSFERFHCRTFCLNRCLDASPSKRISRVVELALGTEGAKSSQNVQFVRHDSFARLAGTIYRLACFIQSVECCEAPRVSAGQPHCGGATGVVCRFRAKFGIAD